MTSQTIAEWEDKSTRQDFLRLFEDAHLDINLEENPFPELSAIRALVTASKLRYGISKRLALMWFVSLAVRLWSIRCRPAQPLRSG